MACLAPCLFRIRQRQRQVGDGKFTARFFEQGHCGHRCLKRGTLVVLGGYDIIATSRSPHLLRLAVRRSILDSCQNGKFAAMYP